MFWDTKDPPSHNIEILLESPDTKVEVFLEEDNIIQECKTQKKNIVNYFTRPDVLRRMIELIITEPPEEIPISERFRHANVACEILTMGLPSLDEKLLADTDTLNMLYSYLENEPPLNPLLASFFSKTFSMLFTRKSDQDWFLYQQTCLKLLEYLKMRNNFLDLICKHFTTPIVPDLIMEMMQNVEGGQLKRSLYEWLNEERLVERLIEIIGDPEQSEKHANVAVFLCDFINQGRIARLDIGGIEPAYVGSDPILKTIESATTLLALFNVILQPNAGDSAIVSGITVVLNIIKLAYVTDERNMERMLRIIERDQEMHAEFLTTVIRVIEPQLNHFNELLKNPPKKPDILTTAAKLSPPFGMARLQIVRLFTELLKIKNHEISKAISEIDFLDTLLSLFKVYCWNNFLHTEVEQCLHTIFPYNTVIDYTPKAQKEDTIRRNSIDNMMDEVLQGIKIPLIGDEQVPTPNPSVIQTYAIVNCKVISKLLECWKINKEMESAGNGRRLGYMGHLINIFKHIASCMSESEYIRALIERNLNDDDERDLWHSIVSGTDCELANILRTQSKLLANHEPCAYNASLDFFTDNNISDAFNGLCTLMDSSDADVIFTLDYNTQHDDHEFDDDDVDEDYNNINNDNNEERDKDQRNDDVKNALNLFQFGRSNDDDAEEDDNAAAPFDGYDGLPFYVEPSPNPFAESSWEKNDEFNDMLFGAFLNMKPDTTTEAGRAFARFDTQYLTNPSTSNPNEASNPATETAALTTISSEEFDNNANVEKSSASSWSEEFTSFPISKKDLQFPTNFFDDYEDDEGMWTKPLGSGYTASTIEQLDTQSAKPKTHTDDLKINLITNGPSVLEENEYGPEESSLNQLSNSIEDNSLIYQTPEDINASNENTEDITKKLNSELNITPNDKEEDEDKTDDTTSKHNLHKIDTVDTITENAMATPNIHVDQLSNAATTADKISDDSTAAT